MCSAGFLPPAAGGPDLRPDIAPRGGTKAAFLGQFTSKPCIASSSGVFMQTARRPLRRACVLFALVFSLLLRVGARVFGGRTSAALWGGAHPLPASCRAFVPRPQVGYAPLPRRNQPPRPRGHTRGRQRLCRRGAARPRRQDSGFVQLAEAQ